MYSEQSDYIWLFITRGFMTDYKIYNIDFNKFNLSKEQFDHQSFLHGVMHTYRVMLHCLKLGVLTGKTGKAKIAFLGAYIHDMARTNDGYCTKHGADASRMKLPLYEDKFKLQGATNDDIDTIRQIVTCHSLSCDEPINHPVWETLAILKDADALDRIRLGTHDLNPEFLRYEATNNCITFGEKLFYNTYNKSIASFYEVIEIANDIESKFTDCITDLK